MPLRVSGLRAVASAIRARYLRLGDGDGEAAKAHVARAMALLQMKPIAIPPTNHELCKRPREIPRGGLALWQTRRIAAHVEANLAGKIHIKDLAGLLDLSSSHFSRAFKCTFGVTAHGWLLRRRIEVAQGLMLTTNSTLTEIAHSCGMADHAHFTHRFRRLVGETPYAWRRMRRG